MLEMGIVVFLGMAVMYAKLGIRVRVWINSHPVLVDSVVFVGLNAIHWGTFSGVMVAAVGALFCSVFITLARRLFGYYDEGRYVPGWKDATNQLRDSGGM